jgi:hypothetical protein
MDLFEHQVEHPAIACSAGFSAPPGKTRGHPDEAPALIHAALEATS